MQDFGAGDTIKYRASYGTGFRPPSLYEVSYNRRPGVFPPASETVLKEEISRGYDFGIVYFSASGLHVELTYFDQHIDDAIYFDPIDWSGYLQPCSCPVTPMQGSTCFART